MQICQQTDKIQRVVSIGGLIQEDQDQQQPVVAAAMYVSTVQMCTHCLLLANHHCLQENQHTAYFFVRKKQTKMYNKKKANVFAINIMLMQVPVLSGQM